MPSARGAPVKPTRSRWRNSEWTAGVHGPALRRTVSPTRTTVLVFPPRSGISCCTTPGHLSRPDDSRPDQSNPRSQPVPGHDAPPDVSGITQQRVDKGLGLERRQVVRALTETDQFDRDSECALDRDD